MIKIYEHFGYRKSTKFADDDESYLGKPFDGLNLGDRKKIEAKLGEMQEYGKKNEEGKYFYRIYKPKEKENWYFYTSYFVGVDWIIENEVSIYIQPKQNDGYMEINYISMLSEALQESENFEHLVGLYEVYFDRPKIEIKQQQDLLSPFLIIEFLQILKHIIQKGLKKSYYSVIKNFEAKIKGKILVQQTIKTNIVKNKLTKNICQYYEFGLNIEENKILKKAFLFARHAIENYNLNKMTEIEDLISYIHPAFEEISDDVQVNKIKTFKPNPLYKEYERALKLAQLILKRFSYNITETENSEIISTPPFWIDMSKLFELYVFKKLREIFVKDCEIKYHLKINYQELDFLINCPDKNIQMVVDAKYKPQYDSNGLDKDDIRQVCGYARLRNVYDKLGFYNKKKEAKVNRLVDCLIIYPKQVKTNDKVGDINKLAEKGIKLENGKLKNGKLEEQKSEKAYINFYKLGIYLPVINRL